MQRLASASSRASASALSILASVAARPIAGLKWGKSRLGSTAGMDAPALARRNWIVFVFSTTDP
jgi:hypothetical protein